MIRHNSSLLLIVRINNFSNAIVNNHTPLHCNGFYIEVSINSSFVFILKGIKSWYNSAIVDVIRDSFVLDKNLTTASSCDSKFAVYNTGEISDMGILSFTMT